MVDLHVLKGFAALALIVYLLLGQAAMIVFVWQHSSTPPLTTWREWRDYIVTLYRDMLLRVIGWPYFLVRAMRRDLEAVDAY